MYSAIPHYMHESGSKLYVQTNTNICCAYNFLYHYKNKQYLKSYMLINVFVFSSLYLYIAALTTTCQ